jgi:hypothetical protein
MLKKILIGVGVIVLIAAGFIGYTLLTTRSHSPEAVAEIAAEDLNVKITYCQPYKKGRVIFGEETEEVLLPHGKYWRLGANDATEITFSQDVNFAGESISAGSYRMYVVPNASTWEVSLNSELGMFGAFEPNYDLDVLKVNVPVQSNSQDVEQLTIELGSDSTGVQMIITWDKTLVTIPITQ